MRITKIKPQKNDKRVNIYIDNKFTFGLMVEVQLKHNLYEGMDIDQEFIDNVLLEEEQLTANNLGLKFLNHRKRSHKEVVNKLESKGFSNDTIKNTTDYLNRYGLIDDLDFAKSFVKDRIHLNRQGPYRIRYDLRKKGISEEIIEEVLDGDNEYPRALELALKKLKTYKDEDKSKIYRKLGAFLQGRGYSNDCIRRILGELMDKW